MKKYFSGFALLHFRIGLDRFGFVLMSSPVFAEVALSADVCGGSNPKFGHPVKTFAGEKFLANIWNLFQLSNGQTLF